MPADTDLPEGLALIFSSLLTDSPSCLRQLQTEGALKAANRHALIGPVVRGLQLLHDHWAYRGVGTLRRERREFMANWDFQANQRKAPIHEMASLAAFLIRFVAHEDDALQRPDLSVGIYSGTDGTGVFLVPPRHLAMSCANSCAAHVRIAYNSLHTPFPSWSEQFSELNLHYIHTLHTHSGYAQTRYLALTCLSAIDAARWRMELGAAASAVSRSWKSIFRNTCQGNKVVRALAQLLLMKTRPNSHLEDKWEGLRRDFWRAAQMVGPPGNARWPQHDARSMAPRWLT